MKSIYLFIIASLALVFSCSDNDNTEELSTFRVHLTDAPAEYEEVLIDVQEIKIKTSEDDDDAGWSSVANVNTGVYNLLDFSNGLDTLLAEEELPAGIISQIRLVLGDNNQVKVDGEYHDLKTPSGQQSGLKLNIHAELLAGIDYNIWLDFDAGRSIVKKGNGTYSLKPVIRTYTQATSGGIQGIIDPPEAKPYILAISNGDSIGTFADTLSGKFLLSGLDEGMYKVEVLPLPDFDSIILKDINVTFGEIFDLDTIYL